MEESLLTRALSLSDELSQISKDDLQPFSGQIGRLSKFYHQLERDLKSPQAHPGGTIETLPACTDNEANAEKVARHRNEIKSILDSAINNIPSIHSAVKNFHQPTSTDPCLTPRTVHLQNIPTADRRRSRIAAASPERILMLCACHSLAEDFYNFELSGGWQPKQTLIIERIRSGQDVAVQQMGKNVHRYVASQHTVMPSIRHKLDAALRVGIKMAAIGEIGTQCDVLGLSLLLGFASDKISRLRFSSLAYLRGELMTQPALLCAARKFGRAVGGWWQACQREYHFRFRDAAPPTGLQFGSLGMSPLSQPSLVAEVAQDAENDGNMLDTMQAMSLPPSYTTPTLQRPWDYDWSIEQLNGADDLLATTALDHPGSTSTLPSDGPLDQLFPTIDLDHTDCPPTLSSDGPLDQQFNSSVSSWGF